MDDLLLTMLARRQDGANNPLGAHWHRHLHRSSVCGYRTRV